MKHPKHLKILDYTYDLPDERIARHPLEERDQSKLLIFKDGKILESQYADIHESLPAGATLVSNNTRVIPARLVFTKPSGGKVEIFCLQPTEAHPDVTTAMRSRSH